MCSSNLSFINIKNETHEISEEKLSANAKPLKQLTESTATKCGEIIFNNDSVILACNFCDKQFSKIKIFIYHFMQFHLRKDYIDSILNKLLNDEVDHKPFDKNFKAEIADPSKWNLFEVNLSDLNASSKASYDSIHVNSEKLKPEKNYKLSKKYDVNLESNKEEVLHETESAKLRTENPLENEEKTDSSITCKVCNKTFRRICNFKRHEKAGHDPDGIKKKYKYKYMHDTKRVICETCGKGFQNNFQLKQHQNAHTGERPYKCELCPQAFAKKRVMVIHMRYHSNDRRYKCQYCEKAFVENRKLRLHEMIHTGTFPIKCSVCDKGFRCRSKLNEHVKRHENEKVYKCNKCDETFFFLKLLKAHGSVHKDEKKFACELCPARLQRKDALTRHMQLHSEIKKYSCKICGKEYHQYFGIYGHMKKHGIKYSIAYENGESDGKNKDLAPGNT